MRLVSKTNTQKPSGQHDSTIRPSRKQGPACPALIMPKGEPNIMSTLETTAQPTAAVPPPPVYAAHIGLDWADQKHFWTMLVEGHKTRGQLDNTPEAIQVWAAELAQRFGGRPVALALEQSRGAVIAVLSKY